MNKKIGIVHGGGGAKGAFGIGALEVILEKIKQDGDELVAVAGTSIGALNTAFVTTGQFEKLKNIWLNWNETNCPLVSTHFYGGLVSLILNGYKYKNSDILPFLEKNLDLTSLSEIKTTYTNTLVRLDNGDLVFGGFGGTKNLKVTNQILLEIMASMAYIPGTPTVTIGGVEFVDGGFRDTIPVEGLLIENPNVVFDKIYVISCNPLHRQKNQVITQNNSKGFIEKLTFVYDDILWHENSISDIKIGKLMHWNKDIYTVIEPEFANLKADGFNHDLIVEAFEHGKKVASGLV